MEGIVLEEALDRSSVRLLDDDDDDGNSAACNTDGFMLNVLLIPTLVECYGK